MNIIFVSQYFPPEIGAASARLFDIVKECKRLGHIPTVISETPHYPSTAVSSAYKNQIIKRETYCEINVIRSFVVISKRENFIQRIALYISFLFSSVLNSIFIKNVEMVFATSPPLTAGLAGYIICRLKKAKYILDIRDLWPESALALNELKKGTCYFLLKKLEIFLYKRADLIAIAVPGFRNHIMTSGISGDRIYDLPNGANLELFYFRENNPALRKKNNMENKFIVLFSGNHGIAQGLESLLYTANELVNYKDIVFVFIGDGVKKKTLMQLKDRLGLNNVLFIDKVTREDMPGYISLSDVCLVPLIKHPLFLNALPSKMFEYMACNKPVIVAIEGEAKEMIIQSRAGLYVEPESISEMKDAVLKLYSDHDLRNELGYNGRKWVEKYFSRHTLIGELFNRLSHCH